MADDLSAAIDASRERPCSVQEAKVRHSAYRVVQERMLDPAAETADADRLYRGQSWKGVSEDTEAPHPVGGVPDEPAHTVLRHGEPYDLAGLVDVVGVARAPSGEDAQVCDRVLCGGERSESERRCESGKATSHIFPLRRTGSDVPVSILIGDLDPL